MVKSSKINFQIGVTKVDLDSIDKIIKLANSDREANLERAFESLEGDFDHDAFNSFCNASDIAFSLYGLAIIHCYSMVEKNRKRICLKIPDLSERQENNLYCVKGVTNCLKLINVEHEAVKCYETMDEFRLVNNAIKHDCYSFSRAVTTKCGDEYGVEELRMMYLDRAQHLNAYLSDLYEKVMTSPRVIEST